MKMTASNGLANDHTEKNNAVGNTAFFKPVIQPKLSINEPGDHYEQEADAMADKVMRMMDNTVGRSTFFKPAASAVQRKCQACEEEDKHVHRKESYGSETEADSDFTNYVSSLNSSGQPMPETSRKFFEPRFGHDFSNVKIHTDSVAAKSAQSINALAYTTGNNIVFNSGQFSPDSDSGKKLIAHELTHVVQQQASANKIQKEEAPGYCPAPSPAVDDKIVQSLIDEQIKNNTDKATEKVNLDMAFAYLNYQRNKKENCCDVNLAAAERYMYARMEMAAGRPFAYQSFLNFGDSFAKLLHLPVPNSGVCPKTRTSAAQLGWGFNGTSDGKADWDKTHGGAWGSSPTNRFPDGTWYDSSGKMHMGAGPKW